MKKQREKLWAARGAGDCGDIFYLVITGANDWPMFRDNFPVNFAVAIDKSQWLGPKIRKGSYCEVEITRV